MEFILGLMVVYIMDKANKTKNKDSVYSYGKMGVDMKAIGIRVNNTAWELI